MLTVNDTAPTLTGTLTSRVGSAAATPVNLTGCTLAVHIKPPGAALVLTKTATAVSAPDGTWAAAAWVAGDLSVDGSYKVEVQVTYGNGQIQTFGPAAFVVRKEIA